MYGSGTEPPRLEGVEEGDGTAVVVIGGNGTGGGRVIAAGAQKLVSEA